MNNLHPIAQAVQSQGRNNDTQLVHMTPGEVQGLQALAKAHGGSLSINPETGLVEAGFLESILPTIAGAGLMMIPGMQPMGAALITGLGATALNGGDLGKGLMAGLGAWGGAGMASSLGIGAAGAAGGLGSGVTAAPAANASLEAANIGANAASPANFSLVDGASKSGMGLNAASHNAMAGPSSFAIAPPAAPVTPLTPMPTAAGSVPASPYALSSQPTMMDKLGSGQFWKDNWQSAAAAAAPVAMDLMGQKDTIAPKDNEQFQYDYNPGRVSEADLAAQRAANPKGELQYFKPSYGPRRTVQVAQGGILGYENGGPIGAVEPVGINTPQSMDQSYFKDMATGTLKNAAISKLGQALGLSPQAMALGMAAKGIYGFFNPENPAAPVMTGSDFPSVPGQNPSGDSGSVTADPTGATETYGDVSQGTLFAQGGIAGLAAGGMAKGGFVVPADVVSALGNGSTDAGLRTLQLKLGSIKPIKGKGDGLSDSIPTSIDGKQPARVADGEAYIDPKTVANIGGGDAKKGAQKLYAMMDKIRQQAHGKKTQQRKVDHRKVV